MTIIVKPAAFLLFPPTLAAARESAAGSRLP